MPSELSLLQKPKRPIATVVYPAEAMALYVHGLYQNFAKLKSV
jgi:hypothetical protein